MADRREIDSGTSELEAFVEDGVAVLRLNRPERLNALTVTMIEGAERALAAVEHDDEVRCVLVTGAGRAFSAGADLNNLAPKNRGSGGAKPDFARDLRFQRTLQRGVTNRIYRMAKPVIASIPGPAVGAGFSLALACDLRIASEDAILTTGFAKIALAGDLNLSFSLTRLVGAGKAAELMFLAPKFTAKEGLAWGLINRVVSSDDIHDEAMAMAREYAAGPTAAIGLMKNHLNLALRGDMDDTLDVEVVDMMVGMRSHDHREGVRSFLEKRPTVFEGR